MNDLPHFFNKCELLLFSRNENAVPGRDRKHEHDCWQVEMVCSGRAEMCFAKEQFTLSQGDIFLIPPAVEHYFNYNEEQFVTWSLKFKYHNPIREAKPVLLSKSSMTEQLTCLVKTVLLARFPEQELLLPHAVPDEFEALPIIESLLDGIIQMAYQKQEKVSFLPACKIRTVLRERHGGKLTVDDAAKIMGYSRCHASLLFKQKYGYSLKTFIDIERIEIAKHYLNYSDLNVSEIADTMGFIDVFHFSKLFKRVTGFSPLNYLKQ